MHWYSCNNAVRLLNKAKSRLFQSITNSGPNDIDMDVACMAFYEWQIEL